MSGPIEQTLGFDVSQALDAVKSLDAAFANLQNTFASFGTNLSAFNAKATSTDAAAKQLGNALRSDVTSGAAAATASTERLTTSLGLLSRIVFTQNVISGLRIIKSEFSGALNAELDFQKKINEIRTISPQDTIASLGDELRGLSNDFNIPLLDVAHAKYTALSSGFTTTADSLNILTSAFQLSKVGISTGEQAVSLLSGALNAFGKSSDEAGNFAAKFFDAIKLGHLVASDLSSNLDKVAPSARSLGVSLEEVLAQFSSLSLGGVKINQAATEINSVFSALIKQSPDAAAAIAKLSDKTDIRETIKDFGGVVPLVKAIVDQANNNPEALGKIFPNVRSLREIFTLTNDGFERYNEHLKEISNFTPQDFLTTYAERVSNNAEKVSSDLNKIHNALDKAFGETIVGAASNLSAMVGGVDSLTAAISAAGPLLLGIGVTLAGLTVRLAAARLGATGFASALGALALVPTAAALGATLGGFVDKKILDATSAGLRKLEEDDKSALDAFKTNAEAKAKAAFESDQARVVSAGEAAAQLENFQRDKGKLPGVTAQESLIGRPFESAEDYGRLNATAAKKADELRNAQTALGVKLQQAANTRAEIDKIVSDSDSRSGARQFPGAEGLRGDLNSFVQQFVKVSQQAKITDQDISDLLKKLGELNDQTQGSGINARIAFGPEVANFATGISKLKELQGEQSGLDEALQQSLQIQENLSQVEQFLSLATPGPAFEQAASATASAADNAARLADNYARAAAAAQQAAQAAASAGAQHQAFGGIIDQHYAHGGSVRRKYFAEGGAAQGGDTVPAMLTPGEFVMNAAAAGKFYSQLTAMNAGLQPTASGAVTNNSYDVGGVHIHESENPAATAREVMSIIRREQRRGTSKLN